MQKKITKINHFTKFNNLNIPLKIQLEGFYFFSAMN